MDLFYINIKHNDIQERVPGCGSLHPAWLGLVANHGYSRNDESADYVSDWNIFNKNEL